MILEFDRFDNTSNTFEDKIISTKQSLFFLFPSFDLVLSPSSE